MRDDIAHDSRGLPYRPLSNKLIQRRPTMIPPLKVSEARARLRRIVDKFDAICLLYPLMDDEPLSEIQVQIQDDDLAMFIQVVKAQFVMKGDAKTGLVTGNADGKEKTVN